MADPVKIEKVKVTNVRTADPTLIVDLETTDGSAFNATVQVDLRWDNQKRNIYHGSFTSDYIITDNDCTAIIHFDDPDYKNESGHENWYIGYELKIYLIDEQGNKQGPYVYSRAIHPED